MWCQKGSIVADLEHQSREQVHRLGDQTSYSTMYGKSQYSNSYSGSASSSEADSSQGSLMMFTFVEPVRGVRRHYQDIDRHKECYQALAHSPVFREGQILDAKEKGVTFPVVHMTDDEVTLRGCMQAADFCEGSASRGDSILHQGVYREVRSVLPEMICPGTLAQLDSNTTGYMLMGFKGQDKSFSQMMVDTWKDWTSARYIYMYLPDELGLSKISLYLKEAPSSTALFMYIVVVECRGITSSKQQTMLLDFAQRLRVERLSGFISVYSLDQSPTLQ